MTRPFPALLASLLLALTGCASAPMADADRDAALKAFRARPGVAGIYIYRNENLGAMFLLDVEVDGQPLGQTAAKTYLYTEVSPGKHRITSKAENDDSIEIDTADGRLYYVWQEVKMGLITARTKLHQVDLISGQKGVRASALAESAAR